MLIYHYHPVTGLFLQSSTADVSPLEPGVFLVPAHSTTTPPPSITPNQVAFFAGGSWEIGSSAEAVSDEETIHAPNGKDISAERYRRLAVGFDYDFGDGRGVHRIGTTESDMAGWSEVTAVSNALIAVGAGSTSITISTDTGSVSLTAMEWQSVLLAAASFRQPIWQSSFVLQQMDPIPPDYKLDAYWP